MSKIETEREIAEARARMKAKEQESCMALEKQMHTNRLTLEREALQSELAMQKERQQAELELRIAQVTSYYIMPLENVQSVTILSLSCFVLIFCLWL